MRFFGYCKSYGAVRCCDVSYGWLIAREKTQVVVLSHVSLARDILSRRWSLRNRMDFFFGRAGFVFVLLDCGFLFFLGGVLLSVSFTYYGFFTVFFLFFFCVVSFSPASVFARGEFFRRSRETWKCKSVYLLERRCCFVFCFFLFRVTIVRTFRIALLCTCRDFCLQRFLLAGQ